MTITLMLNPDQEKQLLHAAQTRGVDADAFLNDIMQKALDEYAAPVNPPVKRVLGLHTGNYWISDDFDAPLPDSFWLGEE